jgi:hypothetical protein
VAPRSSTRWHTRIARAGLRISRRTALSIALAGLGVDVAIALSTALRDAPVVPQWPQFAALPLVFLVHFRTASLAVGRLDLRWREVRRKLPLPVAAIYAGLVLAAWLIATVSILSIGGQPTTEHGQHFLNNHGSLTAVTRSEYRHALVLQQRIFTLIPGLFFGVAVLANASRPWGLADDTRPDEHD